MLPPTSDTALPPASDAWPAGQRFVQAPPQLTGAAGLPKVSLPGANALGSGDSAPMSEADTAQWNSQDWKWDPYAMRALPAPHDGKTLGNKQVSTAGVEPPTSTGVQASQQPAKLPSLAMGPSSRSKGHPTCQVATCETDLTPLKEYHQRYKICEFHLKVHSIVREGKRQRFCQQCGRFHDLTEFDGDKRSCRARLQRHNARRRKKTEADAASKAAAVPKKPTPPAKAPQRNEKRPADSEGRPYREGPHGSEAMELDESFALLPDGSKHAESEGIQDGSGESSGAGASELYSRRPRSLPAPLFEDGMHAPLLDAQASVYSSRAPPSYLMQSERHIAGLPYTAPFPGRSATPVQFPADYLRQAGAAGLPQGSASLLAGLAEQGFGSRPMDLGSFQRATGPRGANVSIPAHEAMLSQFSMGEPQASILNEARRIMQTPPESYISDEQLTRVSAKLFNCTPANLPLDMKQNLIHLLGRGINSMEGYIRPGCVHLTLNALTNIQDQGDGQAAGMDIRSVVERLHATNASLLHTEQMLIQVNEEIALVKNRRVQHVLSCSGSHAVFPLIARVSSQVTCSTASPSIRLYGANIGHPHNTFLCRCQGCWVPCEVVTGIETVDESGAGAEQVVELRFGQGLRNGVIHVEVMRGGMMSTAKPILVLDDSQSVKEIQALQQHMPDREIDALLLDLDQLLEMRNAATVVAQLGSELTRQYCDDDLQHAVELAYKVLRFATARGCAGLAAYVFPVAFCPELAPPMQREEMTLLHLAVRSGSLQMVASLLEWGSIARTEFHAGAVGPQAVTPMHLAALHEEAGTLSGQMVALLADLCEDGMAAWEVAAADGSTPAAIAAAVGNTEASQAIEALQQAALEQSGDFEDEGWPVDDATGDALMLDLASAEDMPLDEDEAAPEEAVRASTDSTGNWKSQQAAQPTPAVATAPTSCATGLTQRSPWMAQPASQPYYSGKPDASVTATVCHSASHDLGLKKKDHDKFLGHSVDGVQVLPTVFGHFEALLSAVCIATIGAATLSVRWYFEYICPDRV